MDGIVPTGGDTPVHGQRHDEQQAVQALQRLKVGVFQAKPAGLEVRKHRLDAPTRP